MKNISWGLGSRSLASCGISFELL